MSLWVNFSILNRFLEDTCVIATVAYLVSRGALLPKLFDEHRQKKDEMILGVIFGLIGASDLIFPHDRYPYVPYTLAAAFASFAGSPVIGGISAFVMILLAALVALPASGAALLIYAISLPAAVAVGSGTARIFRRSRDASALSSLALGAVAAGAGAEIPAALLQVIGSGDWAGRPSGAWVLPVVYAACANGFGSFLLALVLWDARSRQQSLQRQMQAERELSALRLNQLSELQARLHPHFLFNALAAIAGLCVISPLRAEQAIVDLASLLRRFLRTSDTTLVRLSEEVETANTYLAIEQLRLGERLDIVLDLPANTANQLVPRFCLQIPVENAVQHGIVPMEGQGRLTIRAKVTNRHLFLTVADNGRGLAKPSETVEARSKDNLHGLEMLKARLLLTFGSHAKLRLFSAPGRGTICAIRLPGSDGKVL